MEDEKTQYHGDKEVKITKKEQLKKTKIPNPKKLDPCELRGFKDSILDTSAGICQVCKTEGVQDFHHAQFGCSGANKDDRTLVGICRGCHHLIHHSRKGRGKELREVAIEIGEKNWKSWCNDG
ncbi:MAG: hypothetical protein ABXS91_11225 [Sulfurimonas sp.]